MVDDRYCLSFPFRYDLWRVIDGKFRGFMANVNRLVVVLMRRGGCWWNCSCLPDAKDMLMNGLVSKSIHGDSTNWRRVVHLFICFPREKRITVPRCAEGYGSVYVDLGSCFSSFSV